MNKPSRTSRQRWYCGVIERCRRAFSFCPSILFSRTALQFRRRHILKTPTFRSGNGALREISIASASTMRVSAGSITPSSHNRAVL